MPTFLIVGAAKCGTTSLASYLRSHPAVFVPPAKELYFFTREDLWEAGVEAYAAHFADAGDARAVGEATPDYMFFPWSAARIAETLPDVRAVVCLRDPTGRAHSHYLHWRDARGVERRSFARAVDDELAGTIEEARERPHETPPYFGYLARGLYLGQLERLVALLGRQRVHVVLLEDLEADPAAVFAGVCRFLGVDEGFRPPNLGARENAYLRWRPQWLWHLLLRSKVLERMPQRMVRWLIFSVMPPRADDAPAMDPGVRQRLAAFYRPHNEALGAWLARDLSHWGT
ncbi:MAG: sulfotransferase [Solirubrobacteraceae bacterium]